MDAFGKLSRELQVVLGGSVLYLLFSFLDWQQVSFGSLHAGVDEWHGIGIVAGLLVLALLVWEGARVLGIKIELGSAPPGLVSVALALLAGLFTLITFLSHSTARHWPAWVGLLLAIVIGAAAVVRARAEGVQMPNLNTTTTAPTGAAATTAPEPPPAPASPVDMPDLEATPPPAGELPTP